MKESNICEASWSSDQIGNQHLNVVNMVGEMQFSSVALASDYEWILNTTVQDIPALIKKRDEFPRTSAKWKFLNALKALHLENTKPSFIEPLKVVQQNLVNNGKLKGEFIVSCYSEKGRIVDGVLARHIKIMSRSLAEYDNMYRQLVVNTILKVGDKFLFLKRNNQFNDKRLGGYIGMVGGHVNKFDSTFKDAILRELREEINFPEDIELNPKKFGFIKLDTNDISKEHLCVLMVTEIDESQLNLEKLASYSETEELIYLTDSKVGDLIETNELDSWAKKAMQLYLGKVK